MGCIAAKQAQYTPIHTEMPDISIIASKNVMKGIVATDNVQIIFVFGGPGSRKGRIVNALVQEYGFYAIYAEKLILRHLHEKLKCEDNGEVAKEHISTREIEELLQDRPEVLSLQGVLDIVASEVKIAAEKNRTRCLIDFVPNLRSILQVQSFIKNCDKEMHQFETQWPCMFALNLENPELQNSLVVAKNPTALQKSGQSDEKDISKTKKRHKEYLTSVMQFLKYFQGSDRLVTVDVSCGFSDLIWAKVSEFFNSIGFGPRLPIDTILIFAFKPEDILPINLSKMELVKLTSLCDQEQATLEELFICLNERIKKSEAALRSFVVNMEGVTGFDEFQTKDNRQICFLNMNSVNLPNFGVNREDSNFADLPFTAVYCNQNDLGVCLFPRDVPTKTCKRLALLYSQTKLKTK